MIKKINLTDWSGNEIRRGLVEMHNKRADEAEKLEREIQTEKQPDKLEALAAALKNIEDEAERIAEMLSELEKPAEDQPEGVNEGRSLIMGMMGGAQIEGRSGGNAGKPEGLRTVGGWASNDEKRGGKPMENIEIRSFQKYITGGVRGMNEQEQRGLNLNGAAAVLPVTIYNQLITSGKYSDLLHRAKVFNEGGAGKLNIPVASNTAAEWHTELAAGTEAKPGITKIELGGYELMRLMSMSAAAASMTEAGFENTMLQLLSAEVIETLEQSFIKGTGSGQPKGLDNLTWITSGEGQNALVTYNASSNEEIYWNINAPFIAEALSLLPQKYARNAILLMNAKTAATCARMAWSEGSAPAYNATEALERIYGHEVVISEYVGNDTVYIVDPKELYVRFSMPLQIEADRSSGFTSATVDLRALCVVDAAWNPAACVRLTKGTPA